MGDMKIRELTTEEKLLVYTTALEDVRRAMFKNYSIFICLSLKSAVLEITGGWEECELDAQEVLTAAGIWDELVVYRPVGSAYAWFKPLDYQSRIDVLESILKKYVAVC